MLDRKYFYRVVWESDPENLYFEVHVLYSVCAIYSARLLFLYLFSSILILVIGKDFLLVNKHLAAILKMSECILFFPPSSPRIHVCYFFCSASFNKYMDLFHCSCEQVLLGVGLIVYGYYCITACCHVGVSVCRLFLCSFRIWALSPAFKRFSASWKSKVLLLGWQNFLHWAT